jgi:hypothetical protein
VLRSFCSICGSNVHIVNLTNPELASFIIVPMGIVEERANTTPANEYYVKRRAEWFHGVEGSVEYPGMF